MKLNKDFLFGLVTGMAIALTISIGLFNFYVVKTIENTKAEAQEILETTRETFRGEIKEELAKLREKGFDMLEEQKGEVLENLKGRIKDQILKRRTGQDSTATN